ncbi:MAG: hypothetical protein AMXMBFR13_29630 [Phycisphaerae bacterium]
MPSRRIFAATALGLLVTCVSAITARADGFIIIDRPIVIRPTPTPVTPRIAWFPLEVKNHNVTCDIQDTVGITKIDQVFHNPNAQQMEGTYMFPLPEGAAVQKFSMWMNGKEVKGELLDADKARSTYEEIVRKMRDPALLEYVGSRLYKARVFPIPANGDVRIALEYSETISVSDGLATYRYPLNTEKFSSKDIEDVTITVAIKSQVALKSVFCPSHNVTVNRPNDREAKVGFEAHHVKPDKDFVVYYQMSEKEFGLSLLSYKPAGEEGVFMARLAPPISAASTKIVPKDVCFVLDTSGSMAGDKIAQAKKAMEFCLSSLRSDDRFNLIAFSTEARPFRDSLVQASKDNVEAAKAEVQRIEAAGGTAIDEALQAALKLDAPRSGERPFMIVFITDGQPTVGEREPDKILASVKSAANQSRSRIFVFGVGHDLNTKLLDRLGDDNRGTREYIDEKEDIELKISSFFKKVSDPVLSDITLRFGGVEASQIYPKQLPDLFHGSELVVVGRYAGAGTDSGDHSVTITGKRAGETLTWKYEATFKQSGGQADFLPRLWAIRKVGYLMDEVRLHGDTQELKDEIVRLAKRYAIITPYTSYLVMEDTPQETLSRGGGAASGDAAFGRVLRGHIREDLDFRDEVQVLGEGYRGASSGRVGVEASKQAWRLREAVPATSAPKPLRPAYAVDGLVGGAGGDRVSGRGDTPPATEPIQIVGDKTFYFDGQRWIDSAFDAKSDTIKVKAFSDEYFQLLKDTPELGKYLALGEKVIVVLGGKVYEIGE